MSAIIIGIDPGISGGVAWREDSKGSAIHVVAMPTTKVTKKKKEIPVRGLIELFTEIAENYDIVNFIVEEQVYMASDSKGSIFTTARRYERIFAAISVLSMQNINKSVTGQIVRAQSWKAALKVLCHGKVLPKKKKEKTLHMLEDKLGFDWCAANLYGKRGAYKDGLGDAVAILVYGSGGRRR